jgi:hypothetical protein
VDQKTFKLHYLENIHGSLFPIFSPRNKNGNTKLFSFQKFKWFLSTEIMTRSQLKKLDPDFGTDTKMWQG